MASVKDIYGVQDEILWEDLPSNAVVPVTIERAEEVTFDDDSRKIRLSFVGKKKGLTINKTCAGYVADGYGYGDESDNWAGKLIYIHRQTPLYQGKATKKIWVAPPELAAAPVAAVPPAPIVETPVLPAPPAPANVMPMDDIPF